MKRSFLTYLFLLFALSPLFGATPTAASIIEKTVETIRSAPSLSAKLSVVSHGKTVNGNMTLSGDRFAFSSPEMSTWFNGTTLWTYSADTNEVNLTDPTEDELQEVNPFTFIKSARREYTPRLLHSDSNKYDIELSPKVKKSELKKIEVSISKTSNLPTAITLYLKNGNVKITITNAKTGKRLSNDAFTFNKSLFPNAEIVDLR